MELFQLRSFIEIARLGSLSKAAEKLCITQPALSRQMDALEKSVGINLFNRHSRGVNLTEAGRRLFDYTEQVLGIMDEAVKTLKEIQNLDVGQLSIGASTTIGNYLLPARLATFMKMHRGIEVTLHVSNSNEILEQLAKGRYDLAFIANHPNVPGFCIEPLLEDEVLLLVSPDHPLSEATSYKPESLAEEFFIFRESGSATQEIADSILVREGITPTRFIQLSNTEMVKRAVMAGMGITFLSRHTVDIELENKLLFAPELPNLRMNRSLLCVYPKNIRLSPAALAFLSHLKKERC